MRRALEHPRAQGTMLNAECSMPNGFPLRATVNGFALSSSLSIQHWAFGSEH